MATSSVELKAPKISSASASSSGVEARTGSGNVRQSPSAAPTDTARLPSPPTSALPFAGALVSGLGSRAVSVGAALGLCLTLPLPVLASTPLLLALALLIFGAFNSTLDVAMNAQAVEVEQRRGRPIMSSFHALFSVGGLAGAALTGLI